MVKVVAGLTTSFIGFYIGDKTERTYLENGS